jgi:hypothetical protein
VPGPAPTFLGDLQIDQSLEFQQRFHRVQKVLWRLLALLPILAVAGLFGGGVFSSVTTGDPGARVTYDRFARLTVKTRLSVTVGGGRRPVVSLDRTLLNAYDLTEIRPQPSRTVVSADRTSFSFSALPGAQVSLSLQPRRLGSVRGAVSVAGARPVRVHQFIYP